MGCYHFYVMLSSLYLASSHRFIIQKNKKKRFIRYIFMDSHYFFKYLFALTASFSFLLTSLSPLQTNIAFIVVAVAFGESLFVFVSQLTLNNIRFLHILLLSFYNTLQNQYYEVTLSFYLPFLLIT
jgi:hypothetical protein